MIPLRVVVRNITRHPLRSLLTAGSLAVAVFLLATLHSFLRALDATVENADDERVIVQSAVSLFVNLPLSYQQKIDGVEGVGASCKWQWFGGYFQDERNFFAQFGVDQDTLFQTYPELRITSGSAEDFLGRRTACLIGGGLADKYGWKVGDAIEITSNIFWRPDREPWTFDVAGVYEPTKTSFDRTILFFHFDYLDEALDGGTAQGPRGTSTFSIKLAPGADTAAISADIDALFENGPQKTQTVPESAFNAQFVSMWGNIPQFVASIGLGVFLAVLLACVNTMLLAGRQQTHDIGILKALGFTDSSMSGVLLLQSLGLAVIGGATGLALAFYFPALIRGSTMEAFFPGVGLRSETWRMGIAATLLVGLLAGALPAWRAKRLTPVAALRTEG